mmetsp:Transcript_71644/g.171243  ORF Transcript_71644/g.171243 Transcript_71644/m.171243 type:complete len:398 (+) Transcript_71644:150-1343(+)
MMEAASSPGLPRAEEASSNAKGSSAALQDEESVFGVSIADPEILKATQWVLTSVSITFFFLGLQLLQEIEEQEEEVSFSNSEMLWWAIDTCVQFTLVLSGYTGVKRSSRPQLALFWVLSFVSCIESVFEAVIGWLGRETSGLIAIKVCEAIFYAIGVHYGRYLWREAGGRSSLHSREAAPLRSSYNMLGIPIVNLRVLRATQSLFTSLGIVCCILGQIVLANAQDALRYKGDAFWSWLICVAALVLMFVSGYFGVRWSSFMLLTIFMAMNVGFLICTWFIAVIVVFILVSDANPDDAPPASLLWFVFGLIWVLSVAVSNAVTLMKEARNGGSIAAISVVEPPALAGDDEAPSPAIVGAPALRSTADASGPAGDSASVAAAPPPKSTTASGEDVFEDV